MAKKAPGARNLSELTQEDKDAIIAKYYQRDMKVDEITKYFNLTKRTMPALLKEYGINSSRKNRYTLNEDYFSNIDSERKAYWLGYLYADGFVGDEHFHNIVFVQKKSNSYIVEQFAKDISFNGKLRETKSTGGFEGEKQIVINFSSKKMMADLNRLNMFTKKSMTMSELPPIPSNLMRHFVRGYFDGDGSISRSVRHCYADGRKNYSHRCDILGAQAFMEKIADLLPVKTHFVESHTPGMIYVTVWNNSEKEALYHYLYDGATFFHEKKHNVWLQILGDLGAKAPDEKRDKPDEGCPAA